MGTANTRSPTATPDMAMSAAATDVPEPAMAMLAKSTEPVVCQSVIAGLPSPRVTGGLAAGLPPLHKREGRGGGCSQGGVGGLAAPGVQGRLGDEVPPSKEAGGTGEVGPAIPRSRS